MSKHQHQIQPVEPNPDFIAKENQLLNYWYTSGIVDSYLHKNDNSDQTFSFFDGPITANNPMGAHHGWGRTYKDLWQRFYNMKGYAQRFQNGFDCQGLWVEVEVEKDLGFKTKKDIEDYGVAEFVQKCKDRVKKYSDIQTEQSKRLAYFMDWDNSYFTMSDENNYMIWHFLKVCHQKGWIYQGHDSVPWCPRCQTAISQHEILTENYNEITHKSIYFQLPIVDHQNEYLLVWTTTPWTLPANIAVAVDEKLDYSLVSSPTNSDQIWVAKDLVKTIFGTDVKIIKTLKGKDLIGLKYTAPFDHLPAVTAIAQEYPDKFHTVVPADPLILPITTEEGTGLVHTAVSAGTEDFKLGQKLGLPMIPVIADDASYLEGFDFLSGQNAKKHPEIILDYLIKEDETKHTNWVFKIENYKHRYPTCWRCRQELVWKVADEWYISMDIPDPDDPSGRTLRQKMIDVAKKIKWLPKFGLDREIDWLNNMHDWLISKKNRYWGLSLPIWKCDQCGQFTIIGSKEELKEKAISGWDQFVGHSPHKPFIDQVQIKCECGGNMTRIPDVGNPWLDAGIISFSTLIDPQTGKLSYTHDKKYWQKWFPADFITESFPGQFKNWFYSLIAMSTVLEDTNPFKNILGYSTVLSEDGREMHKSWGNAIEFNDAADKMGVDVMRWLYTKQNPERNLLFGYKTADEIRRRFHMILWNSYRYFANYASLENWQPSAHPPQPSVLDQWILTRLDQVIDIVTNSLEKFDAFTANQTIDNFVQDISTWYIRRSRDRVGPNTSDSIDKDAAYHTMHTVFVTLSKLLMPFTPFIADQIYTNLTGEKTVHLANWPQSSSPIDTNLLEQMKLVRQVVEIGHAQRKDHNIPVRQPLSQISISNSKNISDQNLLQLIKEELNVENVEFVISDQLSVELDTNITEDLLQKGEVRKIIRDIQQARKEANCRLDETIKLVLPDWPRKYESEIKQKTLVKEIVSGDSLQIIKEESD